MFERLKTERSRDCVFKFQQCRNGNEAKRVGAVGLRVSERPVRVQPEQQQKPESRGEEEEEERGGGPVCRGPEVLLCRYVVRTDGRVTVP